MFFHNEKGAVFSAPVVDFMARIFAVVEKQSLRRSREVLSPSLILSFLSLSADEYSDLLKKLKVKGAEVIRADVF